MRTLVNKVQDHIHNLNPYTQIRSELVSSLFYNTFDVVEATTPELLDKAHRLRYQVFCIENKGYEDPSCHPDMREKDMYDKNAKHALLIYKESNLPLGTVRIVLPNPDSPIQSFPLQGICSALPLHDEVYIRNSCEISRLCISQESRNKIKDDLSKKKHKLSLQDPALVRMALSMAPIGLISGCFEMALKSNIMNCYGIMEPHHLAKLVSVGLKHKTLGENIEYHGERTPFMMNILETLDHALTHRRDIWSVATNRGEHHKLANLLGAKQQSVFALQH